MSTGVGEGDGDGEGVGVVVTEGIVELVGEVSPGAPGETAGDGPAAASELLAGADAVVTGRAAEREEIAVVPGVDGNAAGDGVGVGDGVSLAFMAASNTFGPFCTIRFVCTAFFDRV